MPGHEHDNAPAGTTAPPLPAPSASSPDARQERVRTPSLVAAVRTVSSFTLLSRVTGLARDVLLARLFGATLVGSAFAAGFAIPNTFRRLFGEGALTAAFVPRYTQAQKHDPALARHLAGATVAALLLAATAVVVIIELLLMGILALAPYSPGRTLSLHLIMLMLPFTPLVCAAAILAGILQVHGRFGPASSGPLILNAVIIAGAVYAVATGQFGQPRAAYMLGLLVVATGLVQCAWFGYLLRRHLGMAALISPWRSARQPGVGEALGDVRRRFMPALIGMGTLQVSALIDMIIAMWPIWFGPAAFGVTYPLDERSNSILVFTQRLYQFPLGVFGIAVATAAFPMLSRHADEPAAFMDTLRRGLRLSLFIGLPASIGLILVRHDLTAVLFSGGPGGFLPDDLLRSSAVLLGYAPAVWAYSLNHILIRAFYARGDTSTPVKIALWILGLNLVLNIALIFWLREAGLAWATSLAAITQCAVLALVLRQRLERPLLDAAGRSSGLRTFLATAAMAIAVVAAVWAVPTHLTWMGRATSLFTACAAGIVMYLLVARVLRSEELRSLLSRR